MPVIPALFFLSGFAALVYQVLWLRELGLVFGNTAHAAASGLTIFFLGLAAGGYYWGVRAPGFENPLRAFARLEFGVAASALLYFGLFPAYRWVYSPVYTALGESFALLLAAKAALAALILLPPAFLMGGTFPVLGQHLVRHPGDLGRTGSLLYGLNTIGAALGAFAAGFYLPAALGFRTTYVVAVTLSAAIGAVAWRLSEPPPAGAARRARRAERRIPAIPRGRKAAVSAAGASDVRPASADAARVWTVAFLSGFLTLGLEVVWIRMFAQVLENSVYSFAAILVIVLLALGLGALVANHLSRLRVQPWTVLPILLALAGLAVAVTPFRFVDATGGLWHLGAGRTWAHYTFSIFGGAATLLLVPGILIGTVFPYLLQAAQAWGQNAGPTIGRLVAVNTSGAIIGSLLTGFVLLSAFGLWGTSRLFALAYLLLASALAIRELRVRLPVVLPAAGLALVVGALDPAGLPLVHLDPTRNERLIEAWEGNHGVVAVIEQNGTLRMKLNNYYSLGGTADLIEHEQAQALLPLVFHPESDAVFFLGLGTGITAGEALRHPVRRLVACELVPEVVTAARKHFDPYVNGLFQDPRARVLVEDGRSHLMGTADRYDLIIADLFVPWQAGTASLYTREHFQAARSRLRPGGAFVQWLPLFQLSEAEFFIIARTMVEVFPEVVMWRGDFYATKPILALVGFEELPALDPAGVGVRGARRAGDGRLSPDAAKAIVLPFYAGNLGLARRVIPPGPINTDDRPVVEFQAPVTQWQEQVGAAQWFSSIRLARFFEAVLRDVPVDRDPYLSRLNQAERGYVESGLSYYRAVVHSLLGLEDVAARDLQEFLRRTPEDLMVGGPFIGLEKLLGH